MTDITTFKQDVYNIIAQIPVGSVVTYGDVARLAGWPLHSRLVGRVLSAVPDDLELPCHRVVNSQGRLSPVFPKQRQRLEAEGILLTENGKVNLKKFRWEFEEIDV